MKKTIIILSAMVLSLFAFGEEIVRNGSATKHAVYDFGCWRTENGAFIGTGGNLTAARTVCGDNFEVSGRLALARVGHTASGLMVNDALWSFDSGMSGSQIFVEDSKGVANLLPTESLFKSNEFFDFILTGKDGLMTMKINGRKIGDLRYDPKKDCTIAIRPWRATLMIKSLELKGTPVGFAVGTKEIPLLGNFTPIDRDLTVKLPQTVAVPEGICQGKLGNADNSAQTGFKGMLKNARLTIPAEALRKAYMNDVCIPPYKLRSIRLEIQADGGTAFRGTLLLFDPAVQSDFGQGEIKVENGRSRIYVNSRPEGLIIGRLSNYDGNPVFLPDSFRAFAEQGVNGHLVLVYPYHFIKNGKLAVDELENSIAQHIARVLSINPVAYFKIQFSLLMPESWIDVNPEELVELDNKLNTVRNQVSWKRQPSYASLKWRDNAAAMLTDFLETVKKTPYADRIVYCQPLYGNAGEWNHWGYHEKAFVDYSKPMQNAFRQWLRKRYSSNEALQKAWQNPDITFESEQLVPPRSVRNSGIDPTRLEAKSGMWATDYYTFFNEYTADTISFFAGVIKHVSNRRLLVGAYYGYFFGHYNAGPYHFQDSGHYGVGRLLQSPDIDCFGGPYIYNNRIRHLELNGIANSPALHGKLWVSEEDTRTHLSEKNEIQNGATADLNETLAILKRNLMLNLERGSSCYYFDFMKDWYRDPEVMTTLGQFQKFDQVLHTLKRRNPQVAMIFSEETVPYLTPGNTLGIWKTAMHSFSHAWSVPYDSYLLSDLDRIDFSKYQMMIFTNCYYADTKIVSQVRKLAANDNRTLVFLYLPGVLNSQGEVDLKQAEDLTGIPLALNRQGEPVTSISSPWQKDHVYRHTPFALKSTAADASANLMGTLSDGSPAMAVKKFNKWTSVVIFHPMPDAIFMRGMFDYFKIHKYASGQSGLDDILIVPPLYAVYSRIGGGKRIFLPQRAEIVVELFSGKVIGRDLYGFDHEMPRHPHCSVFFAGSIEDYLKFKSVLEQK
ncbi:MAG: hypothetical protein BWY31_03338 [Lentisphaerae bacterium ADurb.Bin242]|nr:MAG: hypothetical protein BWY31_03338 [Lentisphaerae bacterium ADurb.Bin242]